MTDLRSMQRMKWSSVGSVLLTILCVGGLSVVSYPHVSAQQPPAKDDKPVHPEFPPGDGRDTTLRLCTRCHSPTIILATGRDRQGWEAIISKMVTLGATGTDEDFTQIADYLTASFPPVEVKKLSINKATSSDVAASLAISPADADSIITYRDKNGPFKSLDDLKKVPNIDVKNLDARKDRILY